MLKYIRQRKICPREVLQDPLHDIYGGLGVGKENKQINKGQIWAIGKV